MYRPIQVGPAPPQRTIEPGQEPPTPNVTNPKLQSKRGRITAIACVPCKKRKSKVRLDRSGSTGLSLTNSLRTQCNGIRPTCNTCAQKGTQCGYDMGEEHRWQGTLRVNVRKLEKELEDLKSILPLFATSSEREAAAKLAVEIQENGFAARSVEEVRRILQGEGPMTEAPPIRGNTTTRSVTRLEVPSSSFTSGYTPEGDSNVQQTPVVRMSIEAQSFNDADILLNSALVLTICLSRKAVGHQPKVLFIRSIQPTRQHGVTRSRTNSAIWATQRRTQKLHRMLLRCLIAG